MGTTKKLSDAEYFSIPSLSYSLCYLYLVGVSSLLTPSHPLFHYYFYSMQGGWSDEDDEHRKAAQDHPYHPEPDGCPTGLQRE